MFIQKHIHRLLSIDLFTYENKSFYIMKKNIFAFFFSLNSTDNTN